jgi:hypothetical protein
MALLMVIAVQRLSGVAKAQAITKKKRKGK